MERQTCVSKREHEWSLLLLPTTALAIDSSGAIGITTSERQCSNHVRPIGCFICSMWRENVTRLLNYIFEDCQQWTRGTGRGQVDVNI